MTASLARTSATRAHHHEAALTAPRATFPTELPARRRGATKSHTRDLRTCAGVRRRPRNEPAAGSSRRRVAGGAGEGRSRAGPRPRCAHAAPRTMPAPACSTRTHACTTPASSTPVRASRSLAAPLAALMPRRLRASGIRAWRSRRRGATRAEAPACDPLCAIAKVTVAVHNACSSAARTPTPWVRFLRMSCVGRASIQHSAQRACPVCRVVSVSAYSTL